MRGWGAGQEVEYTQVGLSQKVNILRIMAAKFFTVRRQNSKYGIGKKL